MSSPIDIATVTREYLAFRAQFQTLVLSTVADGQPHVSYAPFIEHDGAFFVYVSELAAHTRHLLQTGRGAVLLIEDEQDSRNLFARRRISYQCDTEEVEQNDLSGQQVLAQMQSQFGDIFALLQTLKDFHLIRLNIVEGNYVAGFGKAFAIRADGTLEHVSRL